MAEQPDRIKHVIELPEEGIPMQAIEVVDYIDEDGDHAYAIRTQGTESLSALLGLLELAKAHIIRGSDFND